VAFGAGVLLSGSSADVKAAAATATATKGASSKLGTVLDEVVANLMGGVSQAFQGRVDSLVNELKQALGAPTTGASTSLAARGPNGANAVASNATTTGAGSAGAAWAPQSASSSQQAGFGAGGSMATPPASTPDVAGGAGQGYQPTRAD
jgi:hypothetical protein